MSGIIGGAGSRSGVIGTTELDYETGEHIMASAQGDGTTITLNTDYQTLTYVKIGDLVHISGYIVIDSVTGTPTETKLTLPFTCKTGNQYTTSVAQGCYEVDYTGTTSFIQVASNTSFLNARCTQDNASWTNNPARGGDQYTVSLTYRVA